ncbi:penicillin-binding protein 1A [Marinihelvus fidelis]|uniref:Penicillin-binding protein 1A n=1 Tax=Marinihelvus fidelis TaxID=2613842 RepID=A0A5N0T929_9GAMM|nr:penicillin-binding protein 1A [Marinihelvus fidelis]KAA9131271.1 penicillin-binding protein 1A [Marinihelvus fidelis]
MKKLLKWIFRLGVLGIVVGAIALGAVYYTIAPTLPDVEALRDVRLQVPLRVYSADGKLINVFGEKRRIPVRIEDVPDNLKYAFIAGEDARFFEHPGVDWQGLTRAVWTLATTGEKSIGGSTITQMLARNYFLTLEKTFTRKTKEIFLALKIEREFTKDEILELFLNKILLGHRAYGVGAAADVYYGKTLDQLTLAQSAMIAALPKAPSRINPITSPERALERRNYVLSRMLELDYISQAEHDAAVAEADNAFYHGATTEVSAPYLAEMVRAEVYGRMGEEAYTGGYRVFTTVRSDMQAAANEAIRAGLEDYDHRHGYRGAEARIDLGTATGPAAWDEALSPYRAVAGLVPGLVTEADAESALVYLADGQTVALALEDMAWAKKFISRDRYGVDPKTVDEVVQPGDIVRVRRQDDGRWQLGQVPDAEAALVSIDPDDGAIRALVGGFDFSRSKFNRITQSVRQPGSSFKPFVYSAALERGFTTASLINDAPIVFEDTELERTWKPQNFSEKFFGPTRLREAMVNSRNLVSIRLLRDIGISYAREYISEFGFDVGALPANLSMALGTADLPPLSMARGYAVFANGGYRVDPYFVDTIEDDDGRVIYRANPPTVCPDCEKAMADALAAAPLAEPADTGHEDADGNAAAIDPTPDYRPLEAAVTGEDELDDDLAPEAWPEVPDNLPIEPAPRAISEQNAYLVRSMMMDVIRRGTGKKAMELGRNDLAGKTGTTNDQRDAWFSGYNSELVTTVWVGFDSHDPLGRAEVGGRAALPIWIDFMRVALEGVPDTPAPLPPGLVQAKINPDTGLLAALESPGGIMEVFEAGHLPDMEDHQQGVRQDAAQEEDPYDIY